MDTPRPEIVSLTLFESFHRWVKRNVKYNKLFKQLHENDYTVITSAFGELSTLKPGTWDLWWAQEHMRFKNIKNENMRIIHELMYVFLSKYCRGQLNENNNKIDINTKNKRRSVVKKDREKTA